MGVWWIRSPPAMFYKLTRDSRAGMTKLIVIAAVLASLVSAYVFFFWERLWTLAIPVALAFLPLAAESISASRRLAGVSSLLMFVWVALGALTVGLVLRPQRDSPGIGWLESKI